MKIIVCGGRNYHDWQFICKCLDHLHSKKGITLLIEGGANGADAHAGIWADNNGVNRITAHANWNYHGGKAGPIRNQLMMSLNPDGVVAFDGGRGTKSMISIAEKAGVKVWRPEK